MTDPGTTDPGTTEPETLTVLRLPPAAFRARLPELVDVYVAAMRYPGGVGQGRLTLWEEHSRRAHFDCVVAVDASGAIRGLAYGYQGLPGQWWFTEVQRGARLHGGDVEEWLTDFFELTELHVRPDTQGSGLGEILLRRLLDGRGERDVLLSTPEGENRAWRLYRRLGFQDVLRGYRFTGDARPFGILGRHLPVIDPILPPDGAAGGHRPAG